MGGRQRSGGRVQESGVTGGARAGRAEHLGARPASDASPAASGDSGCFRGLGLRPEPPRCSASRQITADHGRSRHERAGRARYLSARPTGRRASRRPALRCRAPRWHGDDGARADRRCGGSSRPRAGHPGAGQSGAGRFRTDRSGAGGSRAERFRAERFRAKRFRAWLGHTAARDRATVRDRTAARWRAYRGYRVGGGCRPSRPGLRPGYGRFARAGLDRAGGAGAHPPDPHQPPDHIHQVSGLERLAEKGVDDRLLTALPVGPAPGAHDCDRQVPRPYVRSEPGRRTQPVQARHDHVERDDIRAHLVDDLQALCAVCGGDHLETFQFEVDLDQLSDDLVVVNHEDPTRHPLHKVKRRRGPPVASAFYPLLPRAGELCSSGA